MADCFHDFCIFDAVSRSFDVFQDILKQIVFPFMCFTDQDQEMWDNDPHEYIRLKFG